jgi:NADH dehydrogenase
VTRQDEAMILVLGATSHPGQKLVPLLLDKGYQVRALTRDSRKSQAVRSLGAEVFEGDLRQPDILLRACKDAEAVVSSVTAPMPVEDDNVLTVDEAGNCSLMKAAKRCGVRQFILVSIYGAAPNHPIDLFRIKYRTEASLKALGMDYTILRPTAFMDTWCAHIGVQVTKGQEVTIFGDGKNRINFVAAEDIAKFIVFALEDPRLCNQTLTIGGPENLTFDEVVSIYESFLHKSVNRKYVSAARMKLMNILYSFFNETQAHVMSIRHELATCNWQVNMNETIKHYPINLIKLEDWLPGTIGQ